MKKLILILGVSFFSLSVSAQKRNDLKSPQFKNFKIWNSTAKATVIFIDNSKRDLKGPAYKNFKPWQKNDKNSITVLKINSTRPKLLGPAYKNQKPSEKYH